MMKVPKLIRSSACATACLFGLLFAPSIPAQSERAAVVGTVRDATGAVVAGVEIEVVNEATGIVSPHESNSTGAYVAPNLEPGFYTITATAPGFRRQSYSNFELQVGQRARLDIQLEVGEVTETVEVSAAPPLLESEDAAVGQVIAPEPIRKLPLNGRNFAQLAILSPGVSGLDYAQPNTINSGNRPDELRPGGTTFQANGVSNLLNQMTIDGIDATEMISQTLVVRPTVEGIREFKVSTNNGGAEFGRGAGALITINTKSGTNEVHGTAFHFLRNAELDAKNFFDRPNEKIPKFIQNQFGGSIGGRLRATRPFSSATSRAFASVAATPWSSRYRRRRCGRAIFEA